MNEYEVMLMLDPEVVEERQNEILARVRELVERGGGVWQGHEPWGRRKLAYEIDKKSEAHYHLLLFDAAPGTLDELTRVLRITEGAMRHMAVRRVAPPPPRRPGAKPGVERERGDRERGGERDRPRDRPERDQDSG